MVVFARAWKCRTRASSSRCCIGRRGKAGFNDEGGRDEESKSWDKREIAGENEDNAELVEDDDPFHMDDVGDGGGDGFGRPVMIFVAGRMSWLVWPFFPLHPASPLSSTMNTVQHTADIT
jgi:hypothetical protein